MSSGPGSLLVVVAAAALWAWAVGAIHDEVILLGGPWMAAHCLEFCWGWLSGMGTGALSVGLAWLPRELWRSGDRLAALVWGVIVVEVLLIVIVAGHRDAVAEAAGRVPAGLPLQLCVNWPIGIATGIFFAGLIWWTREGAS